MNEVRLNELRKAFLRAYPGFESFEKSGEKFKQEVVHCNPDHLSIDSAREAVDGYIDHHNEVRPRWALFGYTPGHVHRTGNKSMLVEQYRRNVRKTEERRLRRNVHGRNQ